MVLAGHLRDKGVPKSIAIPYLRTYWASLPQPPEAKSRRPWADAERIAEDMYGAKGYRVGAADELVPILKQAIADQTVVVVDCPVDYSENMKLTEKLGKLVCPI